MSDTENKDANTSPKKSKDKEEAMDVEDKTEVKNDIPQVDSPPSSEPNTPNKPEKEAKPPAKSHKKKIEKSPIDEEEEELPLGLLERPVIITSGKRERKKTDRLPVGDTLSAGPKKKIEIPEGPGTKLTGCPRIEQKISQTKSDDLKLLHRILFNRAGSQTEIKKNIRLFCGYSFSRGDKEYDKKMLSLNKLTMAQLKSLCMVLDLERSGQKVEVVNRVMDFLLSPENSGKPLPKPKKKAGAKKAKGEKKRKRSTKKESKTKKSKEDVESDEDDDDEEEEEKEDTVNEEQSENEAEESEEEESEEEAPPKKKKKKESQKKEKVKKEKSKENGKKEKASPKKKKAKAVDSDEDSSDDEPLGKKINEPPNNSEIKSVIEKILDGADLEEVTMKTVVKQVYAKYPSFDLSDKKDFIKSTVKQIIS